MQQTLGNDSSYDESGCYYYCCCCFGHTEIHTQNFCFPSYYFMQYFYIYISKKRGKTIHRKDKIMKYIDMLTQAAIDR